MIENTKKVKKKVIPYYCLSKLTQLFDRIDKDNKGYISLNDFRVHMIEGIQLSEIENTFNKANKSGDGKLKLSEFV